MKKMIVILLIAVSVMTVILIGMAPEYQEAKLYKEVEQILESEYCDGDVIEIWDVEDNGDGTYRVDYEYINEFDGDRWIRVDYYVSY